MNIRYCGAILDFSGYGEANRHDIAALLSAGIGVTVESVKHCTEIGEFGELGRLVKDCIGKPLKYKIKFLHTTPNLWPSRIEPDVYHIGRCFWETDKLPEDFARGCEAVDEIWTGSEYNKAAIKKAGVTKPIYIIPEAITVPVPEVEPFEIDYQNTFKFYSVFEWTERKNPLTLLEAYWREFKDGDNVSLTLKTYVDNFTPAKQDELRNIITKFKKKLGLPFYCPVRLYLNLLSRDEIYRFHKTFDCFVSPHRGEGWGIPQMEAALTGNPIISTNLGGVHEYLENGVDALLLTSYPVSVNNTRNQIWYTPDQKWGSVKLEDLQVAMRTLYKDRDLAKKIGKAGKEKISTLFNVQAIGKKMLERLEQIKLC